MAGQPLNATFFAFKKREGGLLLRAGLAYAIVLLIAFVLLGVLAFFLLGGAEFFQWYMSVIDEASKGGTPTSTPPNMGAIFMIFPLEMIFIFIICVLLASFESACLRWMIRDERSGPLSLCFGADMWRVYGTYWVWFLFFLLSGVVFFIAMLVVGLLAGAVGGKDSLAGGIAVLAFVALWVLGWIYTAVRLAPAAATSVGVGHFAPLKAWSVSRDRFWALFGAFLLLTIIYFVAIIIVGAIAMGPFYASIFSQVDWSQARSDPQVFSQQYEQANMHALRNLFSNPVMMASYIGGQIALYVVGVVFYVLFYGVNARAVQAALEEGKIQPEAPSA